jgi:hypothetical protein
VRLAFGKGLYLVPFGVLLVGEWSFASRLGSELAQLASATVVPVAMLAEAGRTYDPFSFVGVQKADGAAEVGAERDGEGSTEEGLLDGEGEILASSPGTTGRKAAKAKNGSLAGRLPSIRVSSDTVFRIAQSGRRPSGKPVAAIGRRPAGIQVFGAAALGIGVRDGDVLSDVSGVPVTTVGQVFALVIAARGARQSVIQGRLWRGQRSYTIVVEQPYLTPADAKTMQALAQSTSEGGSVGTTGGN